MKEVKKITKPQDMCVGQLYMYLSYGRLKRGFCEKIEKTSATFRFEGYLSDTITFIESDYREVKYNYIAEYNARIYDKYQKLKKQHEKECEDCLNGDYVYIKEILKEKWYNRFLRKKKKKNKK